MTGWGASGAALRRGRRNWADRWGDDLSRVAGSTGGSASDWSRRLVRRAVAESYAPPHRAHDSRGAAVTGRLGRTIAAREPTRLVARRPADPPVDTDRPSARQDCRTAALRFEDISRPKDERTSRTSERRGLRGSPPSPTRAAARSSSRVAANWPAVPPSRAARELLRVTRPGLSRLPAPPWRGRA
jgi:hypothetical protein